MRRYFTRDSEWAHKQVSMWNDAAIKYDQQDDVASVETINIDGGLYHAVVFHRDGECTGSLDVPCDFVLDDDGELTPEK